MVTRMRISSWEFAVGEPKEISGASVARLEEFLNDRWRKVWCEGAENIIPNKWGGLKKFGVSSPVIRIDLSPCSAEESEVVERKIYEIEMRPGGLGVLLELYRLYSNIFIFYQTKEKISNALRGLNCAGFVNILSSIKDDEIAAKILELPFYKDIVPLNFDKGVWWVRTDLRQGEMIKMLEKNSLVPIQMEGYKFDLVELGLAQIMIDESFLDWSRGFVIKPLQGSRAEDVEIYLPTREAKKVKGVSTKTRILRTIESKSSGKAFIVQPYIPPLEEKYNGVRGFTIWRVFFGWSGKYEYIGGLWNWRPTIRVHGASDCAFGPLVMDSLSCKPRFVRRCDIC